MAEQQLLPFPAGDQKVTKGCRTQKCPHQLPSRGGRDHSQSGMCMAGNLSCSAPGCSSTTNPEVALQELVDQMRMMEVPSSSLPSSCSSSSSSFSAITSFLLLSAHSWPRAKQSSGCREERQAGSCRWPPWWHSPDVSVGMDTGASSTKVLGLMPGNLCPVPEPGMAPYWWVMMRPRPRVLKTEQ